MIYHYKLGLAQVEARLAEHRSQELKYYSLLESQRLEKNKVGLGYSVVPPPPAQIYSPPKKDMSWTGLPEFKDDTITNYSRPSPAVESSPDDAQNKNPSVTTTKASPNTISHKPFIKFVKENDSPTKSKTDKVKTAKKPPIKYAEQYRKPTKKPNVRGNQKNWNNLKSHHLGINFVMKKKACFNCGDFNHLAYDCSKRVKRGTSRPQNNTHKNFTPRPVVHRPYRPPMRPMRPNMNAAQPNRTSFYKPAHSYTKRPFQRTPAVRLQYRGPRVPPVSRNFSTVNRKFPTANRKFPTGGTKYSTADLERREKLIHRQHNMYSIDLNNIVPHKDLTCLVAKASANECLIWHRRLDNLEKFEAKGDEGYFIGYSISRKAFGVFNKRTKRVEENLLVDFLENKAIEKGTKYAASQEVKKDVSSLRYIALPNWVHDALLESSSMETPIPTVCSPLPTACLNDSLEPLSDTRLISKRVASHVETPSLYNILTLTNRFEGILRVTTHSVDSDGVEADVSNMEITITASPTPTLRIHKDHPKSQIIGPVDTPIQTRNKSKEVGEQSFIARIHQKTDPPLLQFCLFSCFISQVEPKKIFDAL
uniref:Retrovirus-related Pol polyprotein from transposon TNT 1-94 n=1 Tax=Tanacetum cinerariifolium TaxID=118510 RepID=A0A699JHC3_TANCI|nr:retrovirus-related Pol polyprotein from transposon TNT 1-94 [Tanacetum cinerariifolium]